MRAGELPIVPNSLQFTQLNLLISTQSSPPSSPRVNVESLGCIPQALTWRREGAGATGDEDYNKEGVGGGERAGQREEVAATLEVYWHQKP